MRAFLKCLKYLVGLIGGQSLFWARVVRPEARNTFLSREVTPGDLVLRPGEIKAAL
jgi:hypothetical protein